MVLILTQTIQFQEKHLPFHFNNPYKKTKDLRMKKTLFILLTATFSLAASAQFVAKLEMTEHIEGICDSNEVYALIPSLKGQKEATCLVSKEEIQKRLNEIPFLNDNPKYKD